MLTLDEISKILCENKFKDTTDTATKRRTKNKLYFDRSIYSIVLDDTGGGVIVELYKNSIGKDNIHKPSKECLNGLFTYIGLSSFHKKSINKKLLHLDVHYLELKAEYPEELTAGQKKFIENYDGYNTTFS